MTRESERKALIKKEVDSIYNDAGVLRRSLYNNDLIDPAALKRIAKSARIIAETIIEAQGESS